MVKVFIRLMFLRIGEIDTLNEKYQAKASIEARWATDLGELSSNLSSNDQQRLENGKPVVLHKYAETHWHPQLSVENVFGDIKEQVWYSAKKSKKSNEVWICEHRDVKGLFWEKLELHYYPSDVQDLSIPIASMFYDDQVILIAHPHHMSGLSREAVIDQQEWSLYEHVDTEQRSIEEFLFQAAGEHDNDQVEGMVTFDDEDGRKRSVLTIKCHAGLCVRKENHFTGLFSC